VEYLRAALPYLSGVLVTSAYAIVSYVVLKFAPSSMASGVMSVAFLFTLPVAIGALSVALAPPDKRGWTWYLLGVPWLSSLLMVAVASLFVHEAIICVVMALPLLLPLVTVGAVLAFVVTRTVGQQWSQRSPLLLVALLPYVVSPLEAQIAAPDSEHVVHNSVIVYAPPEAVWQQIIRVPAIKPAEQSFSPLRLLGLPRPVEATLSYEGVGAVRRASFERGLLFVETVHEWNDRQSIGFSIQRDRQSVPPEPLGAIGGPFFDMLDGRYEIQPIGDGRVILHLTSTHRLSTRFNWYAGLWTEPIMSELQRYILEIVKARAEARA
jgi:hypothetical protein